MKISEQDRAEFERRYLEEYRPLYEEFASRLQSLLEEVTNNAGIPVDKIASRVKTVESFLEKIERKPYIDPFTQIQDCVGVRVITYYLDDVERVTEIIRKNLEIDNANSIDKLLDLSPEEFGYRSVHLVVSLPESRVTLDEWNRFAGLSAEIQVRSILQHAWADLSHRIDYKNTTQVPHQLLRRLFRLSALVETADEEFMLLRDMSKEIAEEYRDDVIRGDLDLPLNLDSLREFIKQKVDLKKWEQFGVQAGMEPFPELISINKYHSTGLKILLLTLQTVGIATIAEFERLFPGFEQLAGQIRRFVDLVKAQGKTVHAVPMDILILLTSFSKADSIPSDFDWGGKYRPFIIEALRKACQQ
jgi:ppGpp synthetase/RelA/SpoT-type nucleotidyltranferase